MKEIRLTQGQVAKVCDCHYHLVKDYKWHAQWSPGTKSFTATRWARIHEQIFFGTSVVSMHKIINNTPKGFQTDHIDHDTLNNQCSNLRTATPAENSSNRRPDTRNTSGYKGVSWRKTHRKWAAVVASNGSRIFIGYFKTPEEAARAYDKAARELHGEFAHLNFQD